MEAHVASSPGSPGLCRHLLILRCHPNIPPSCRSLTSRKKSTTTPLLSTWRSKDCLHQGARPRGQRKTFWCLSVYYQFSLSNFHKEVALLFAVTVLCNCNTVSSVCRSDCIFFQFVQKWRSSTRWVLNSEALTVRRVWGQILAWWLGELTLPASGHLVTHS